MTPETLDLVRTFVPVGIAALTIIGGAVVYWWQKRVERRNQILQERRELYRKFIGKAQQLKIYRLTKNEAGAIAEYQVFKILLAELLVTAPDGVIETLDPLDDCIALSLSRTFEQSNPAGKFASDKTTLSDALAKLDTAFANTVSAMRGDSFAHSEVTLQILGQVLAISTGIVRK